MIDALKLLDSFAHRGVHFRVEGDRLRFSAPPGELNESDLDQLRKNKERLIELLRASQRNKSEAQIPVAADAPEWPLSYQQARLFFLWQLNPRDSSYNMPFAFSLEGVLDLGVLEMSIGDIARRHHVLATRFRETDGRVVAYSMEKAAALKIVEVPAERVESELAREAEKPFDLLKEELVRWRLFQQGPNSHVLLATFHHIIFDGESLGILKKEIIEFYRSRLRRENARLPKLRIQYRDYCLWQCGNDEGEKVSLNYWLKQLQAPHPILELPGDALRNEASLNEAANVSVALPDDLSDGIRAFCKRSHATFFMLMLAAYKVVISKITAQSDMLIGVPVNGRNDPDTENLLGFFINTQVIRSCVEPEKRFSEYLREVKGAVLDAFAYQDVPFERIVKELNPVRLKDQNAIFQLFFNFIQLESSEDRVPVAENLTLAPRTSHFLQSKFDLAVYAVDRQSHFDLHLAFKKALFTRARIEELAWQYQKVLSQVVEKEDLRIGEISLETDASRLVTAPCPKNGDDRKFPSIVGAIRPSFVSLAQKVAVIQGGRKWTYRQVWQQASAVADGLREAEIHPGDVVGVFAKRGAELVWMLIGILKRGAAFVILDQKLPLERLQKQAEIAGCRALISMEDCEIPEKLLGGRIQIRKPLKSADARSGAETFEDHVDSGDLAYIAFTSGSTGQPKGVLGPHEPVSHFLQWYKGTFAWGTDERFALLSGLTYDPLLRDIFGCFVVGGTLVIPSDESEWFGRMDHWLSENKITVLHTTPPMMKGWLERDSPKMDLSMLRWVFCGGERLHVEDCRHLRAKAPEVTIINSYGATETPQIVACEIIRKDAPIPHTNDGTVIVGKGIQDTRLTVRLADGELAGVGEPGEIWVESRFLAEGYVFDPALSLERFVRTASGERCYRTGDLGRYRVDGTVEFHGRMDRQLKIQGVRVEPAETEQELLRLGFREALVTGIRDATSAHLLVAFVVGKASVDGEGALRSVLSKTLRREQIPVCFISVKEIPRNSFGKIDRDRLQAMFLEGKHSGEKPEDPVGSVEKEIAAIWSDLLKKSGFSRKENFFLVGGHSFLAVRMLETVRKRLGVTPSLQVLFETPTIAAIAEAVNEMRRSEASRSPSDAPKKMERLRGSVSCEFERVGNFNEGEIPLVLVGAAESDVLVFRNLARLVTDRPVYILKSGGLDRRSEAPFSLEELSAFYAERLKSECPAASYALLGWCQGGMVCVEMARHLKSFGVEPIFVGGIDTRSPISTASAGEAGIRKFDRGWSWRSLPSCIRQKFRNGRGTLRHIAWRQGIRLCQRLGIELAGSWRDRAILNRFAAMLRFYRAKPIEIDLNLFWSEKDPEWAVGAVQRTFDPVPAVEGWEKIVRGTVTMQFVPGDHESTLRPPNVAILQARLREVLSKSKG